MTMLSQAVGQAFYGRFATLQPVQGEAVEPILNGLDVLILSGTGSGKTEAVIAPLVDLYLPIARKGVECSLIFVTPTRALANDLLRRLRPPLETLGLSVGIRHGERNDLSRARKPDLLVTTPESLDVMLTSQEQAIRGVRAVVLDEVHLTYNTQRGFQLAILLKRLERFAGRPIQVAGLSATVASASDVWRFFRPGRDFAVVRDARGKLLDYHVSLVPTTAQLVDLVNTVGAGREAKVLLFANSRRECDSLGAALHGNTVFGDKVFTHHSSLDREIRIATERAFQESSCALCVATSTLELGIDIGDIDLVMLYGHPGGWESFLQRVGRGNRRSDKTNVACLVSPDHGPTFLGALGFEALVAQIREGRLEQECPIDMYGAAAQQILSVLLERNGAYRPIAELIDMFSEWPHLGRPTLFQLLDRLAASNHVRPHGFQNRFGAGEELHRLRDLRLIWGNFPSRSREIRLTTNGRQLGAVPASNLLRVKRGDAIRFAGRHWQVRGVRPDMIEVEPSRQTSGIELTYAGTRPPLDATNLEEMLGLLEAGIAAPSMASGTRAWFMRTAERVRRYVGRDRISLAQDERGYHYFTFAGQVVNSVIASYAQVSSFTAGDVVLRTEEPIAFSSLPSNPNDLELLARKAMQVPENLTLFQQMLPLDLLERELGDIWLKTPVFARSLARLRNARVVVAPTAELCELYG